MLNKAMLIGNLGADPELRYTQNGAAVASFTVATTRKWKDKEGQQQEETDWLKIVAWQRLGEICGEYLHKGSKVYVEGRIQTRKWQDKDGNDRFTTEIVASDVQFLSPKGSSEGNNGQRGYQGGQQGQQNGGYSGQSSSAGTGGDVPF